MQTKFEYKNKTFNFVEPSLLYRSKGASLLERLNEEVSQATAQEKKQIIRATESLQKLAGGKLTARTNLSNDEYTALMTKFIQELPQEDKEEYLIAMESFNRKEEFTTNKFFLDVNNSKELLDICLKEGSSGIDYVKYDYGNGETMLDIKAEDVEEYEELIYNVAESFFSSRRVIMKNSPRFYTLLKNSTTKTQ